MQPNLTSISCICMNHVYCHFVLLPVGSGLCPLARTIFWMHGEHHMVHQFSRCVYYLFAALPMSKKRRYFLVFCFPHSLNINTPFLLPYFSRKSHRQCSAVIFQLMTNILSPVQATRRQQFMKLSTKFLVMVLCTHEPYCEECVYWTSWRALYITDTWIQCGEARNFSYWSNIPDNFFQMVHLWLSRCWPVLWYLSECECMYV